jgi:CPA1 family monovalent cation:H+ antiporter
MDSDSLIGSSTITVFWMLVAVAAVALITKRIRLPYTVALVIAGLVIAIMPGVPKVVLTPELILAVFLPVLIFEAAYNLDIVHLRENVRTISALAIPGVLLTAAIVAALIHYVSDFEWPMALLFGAIVAATDPVSVVSTFKQLGAPTRLRVIIEGESLFNDGTALVLFRVILGVILAGEFNVVAGVGQFIFVILGGLVLGVAAGYLVSKLMTRFDDYLIETVLTVILAYGTYFLAEELHVSGVIAVVGAALLVGNYGKNVSFSPTSQIAVGLSWEFFGFLANSLIFLFVGLEVQETALAGTGGYIVVAIAAVLLSRAVVIAGVSWVLRALRLERPVPWSWQIVLTWGGLRGALSLAMALSLPLAIGGSPFPHRQEILAMTFGVILFTLLVQGLTLQPLLKRLGLVRENLAQREYERTQAELRAIRAALVALDRQLREGVLLPAIAEHLRGEYTVREQQLLAHLEEIHVSDRVIGDQQLRAGHRQLLTVEKGALRQLFAEGAVDEETWRSLSAEMDLRLANLDNETESEPPPSSAAPVHEDAELTTQEGERSR